MKREEVKSRVHNGQMVDCTKDEYQDAIRDALQDAAGEFVDIGDGIRAQIALMEVKRLDEKFNIP